jgi:hypothetical protein
MQSFNNVPIDDIDYLLKSNNLGFQGNKYLTVWNFLLTNPGVNVPVSVADYVIAYSIQKNNIPTMSSYDIVKSNYKIQNLSTERTIRIMKYLNKLDETDQFATIPDEVIPKILSELDCDQILSLCKISKRFENICKYHKRDLFDKFLGNKGFTITEYDPYIICKALKFNKRTVECGEYNVDDETYYLIVNVSSNGKVIGSLNLSDKLINFEIEGIKNIISVVYNPDNHYLLFLDSFGKVYKSETIEDDKVYEPLKNPKQIPNLNNIIQIVTDNDHPTFLDINGNVFTGYEVNPTLDNGFVGYEITPILNNIVEMSSDSHSFVFKDTDNNIYGFGSNDHDKFEIAIPTRFFNNKLQLPHKLNYFKNIKNVFMEDDYLITITHDNVITVTGSDLTNYNLNFIKNIVKIEVRGKHIYILNDEGILYKLKLFTSDIIQEFLDVKDFDANNYYLTMLTNSGEIENYFSMTDTTVGLEIKGNAILLNTDNILIDNVLYYMFFDSKKIDLSLIA